MDLPDLSVVVPGTEVSLKVLGITLHALADHCLYLLSLLITGNDLVDWLGNGQQHFLLETEVYAHRL